jgi:hypothetical protein
MEWKMIKTKISGAMLVLCALLSAPAEAKLYKWVDDKGVTQMGDTIPPEYASKDKVQYDDKGRIIKEKLPEGEGGSLSGKTDEQKAAIEQRRKDKALLNTYSNEKEIDLARDRNLQQVEARINSIHLLQQSAQESLDGFRKEANAIKAGKQIPPALQADITAAENKMAKLKIDLDAANAKAASVRATFEADKVRYRELTGGTKK